MYEEVVNVLNVGLVILDAEMRVRKWNHWMEQRSNILSADIEGESLFLFFPSLDNDHFNRSVKSVLTFNSMAFYSQKLHRYCFPIPPISSFKKQFEFMQQNCTFGPVKSPEDESLLFISVQDVTDIVFYETKLREMNTRDALTNAFNRRFLDSLLDKEFKRHSRYKHPLSLIMVDIDHFKRVNDEHGHQCGDHVIKEFSATIQKQLRDSDFLARYGGEEFCCILPETDSAGALFLAERLRQAIEDSTYIFESLELKITSSLGVTTYRDQKDTVELIGQADKALYRAKENGRNVVVVSQ